MVMANLKNSSEQTIENTKISIVIKGLDEGHSEREWSR